MTRAVIHYVADETDDPTGSTPFERVLVSLRGDPTAYDVGALHSSVHDEDLLYVGYGSRQVRFASPVEAKKWIAANAEALVEEVFA